MCTRRRKAAENASAVRKAAAAGRKGAAVAVTGKNKIIALFMIGGDMFFARILAFLHFVLTDIQMQCIIKLQYF